MSDLYEDLGVPRDASAADIKKAFRKRAAKAHPDKGGSNEQMAVINRAFAVLGDEQKRLEYDRSGDTSEGPPLEERARQLLVHLFGQHLGAKNIVVTLRNTLKGMRAEIDVKVREGRMKVKRLKARRDKVITKGGAENLFTRLIDDKVRNLEQNCVAGDGDMRMIDAALAMLEAYEDTEPVIESPMMGSVLWTTMTVGR